MAHSDAIESAALESIAAQVGLRLPGFRPESGLITLHESLQLWLLPTGTLAQAETREVDLSEVAVRSDRWHHQLRDGNHAFGFARSRLEQQTWVLHELFDTPIAASIDLAIGTVDEKVSVGDPLVRLLFAPAFQAYALWILDEGSEESRVVVAHAPTQFDIGRNTVLRSSDLLFQMARMNPIIGLST
jgi:hypothetical protein